jgi:hypothetical protein
MKSGKRKTESGSHIPSAFNFPLSALVSLRRVVDPRLLRGAAFSRGNCFGLDFVLLQAVMELPEPRLLHERVKRAHPGDLQADHAIQKAAMNDEVTEEP